MKKFITVLFIIAFLFTLALPSISLADPSNGNGNAYGHNNPHNPHYSGGDNPDPEPPTPGVVNNYYSSTEYSGTYNDMDVQQTYNYDVDNDYTYDYSQNYTQNTSNSYSSSYSSYIDITNNYIDNSEVLQAISDTQDSYLHSYFHDATESVLDVNLAHGYLGTVSGPPSKIDSKAIFFDHANISLNPARLPLKLGSGEFAKIIIAVTADRPIKLKVVGDRANVRVLVDEVIISEPGAVAYVPVIYTFRKGDYWSYGKVLFNNVYGETLATTSITCDNLYALDWSSSLTTGPRYTDVNHGFRVNRGSWGLSAAIGVKSDREVNDNMVYGTVKVDW